MLKLPPPIWAAAYVLTAVAVSWLLDWPRVPGMPIVPLGAALVTVSWVPALWALMLFKRVGTEVNTISPTNRVMVAHGPFKITRNPMYLGLVILSLGIAVWIGTWPMFIAPVAVFATSNWVHIPFEEEKMRRQFGTTYDNYAARVRRWI